MPKPQRTWAGDIVHAHEGSCAVWPHGGPDSRPLPLSATGSLQGEDRLVYCPLAPAVLGRSMESLCPEVRRPRMATACVMQRLPGCGSSQRALATSLSLLLATLGGQAGASPGRPLRPRAAELASCPRVTLSSPGCSAGTLGWGTWQLIGACEALRSIKDDTGEECSC